jgi:hypothetical protein
MKCPSRSAHPPRPKRRASSIAVKRAYDKPSPQDGMCILIDRLQPPGLSKAKLKIDAWPRELTPSTDLRKWYGHELNALPNFAAATEACEGVRCTARDCERPCRHR